MKMKKWLALVMTVAVLCTAFSGLTFITASAATYVTDYEATAAGIALPGVDAIDYCRHENWMVRYDYGLDPYVDYEANKVNYPNNDWVWYCDDVKVNHTATNGAGIEIAVNRYGYITNIDTAGNMEIPQYGYVLSAHGTASDAVKEYYKNGEIAVGDFVKPDNDQLLGFKVYRVTEDSSYFSEGVTFEQFYHTLAYNALNIPEFVAKTDAEKTEISNTAYNEVITVGGSGVTTGSGEWNTDVLVKISGAGENTSRYKGYVVKVGGNNIAVPEGYFAISLSGQMYNGNNTNPKNAARLFLDYAPIGSLVNCGDHKIYFRYDADAVVRGAKYLTGISDEVVTSPLEDSAATIIADAKANYELVDTTAMESIYQNMQSVISNITTSNTEQSAVTIRENYRDLCQLEFEKRTVEVRATWFRPLPNDRVERTAEELEQLLVDGVKDAKALGYNVILIEAFYNSTTIFPVPSTVGYNGLSYQQNPYLVPTSQDGLNSKITQPYDMLERFIEICKEESVEPHIWWEVFYIGYERLDDNYEVTNEKDSLFDYSAAKTIQNDTSGKYANWLNQSSDVKDHFITRTDKANQYFLNPASTGARTFLMNTFEYVWQTYDAEGFQLDYTRYPATTYDNDDMKTEARSFGYDSDTIAAFEAATGVTVSYDVSFYKNEEWVNFRANYVTTFVEEIRERMTEIAPEMYLTASPGADPAASKEEIMQDVSTWLNNGWIDTVYPMAYGVNIPGNVTSTVVANNPQRFVSTATDPSFKNTDLEMRWYKEVRDAGAAGLSTFGDIADQENNYTDYVWSVSAITPTGNAALAATTYLSDTIKPRFNKMLTLGGITDSEKAQLDAAADAVVTAVTIYGVDTDEVATAIAALQTLANGLSADPKTALNKDIDFLNKIKGNSRDVAKAKKELNVDANGTAADASLTINDINIGEMSNADFVYSHATSSLVVKNDAVISGSLSANVTLYLESNVEKVEFKNANMTAVDAAEFVKQLDETATVKIRLSGDNTLGEIAFPADAYVYGVGVITDAAGTILRCQGDVNGDGTIKTGDLRTLLRYNVGAASLTAEQTDRCDANGDGKINTTDTRLFLEKSLGLLV